MLQEIDDGVIILEEEEEEDEEVCFSTVQFVNSFMWRLFGSNSNVVSSPERTKRIE